MMELLKLKKVKAAKIVHVLLSKYHKLPGDYEDDMVVVGLVF